MEVKLVKEWSPQGGGGTALESGAALAMVIAGGYSLARYRRKLFPLWLAAVFSWFTVCKFAICRHCEHFGQPCEFYNLGVWAQWLWKERSPVSELSPWGWMTEAVSACLIYFLPFFATWKKPRLRRIYTCLLVVALLLQFLVSCRICAQTATDPWKNLCPNYRLGRRLFAREQ